MINGNDLYYDDNEAMEFIKNENGFDEDVISAVLASEFRYIQSVGIVDDDIDY